MFKKGTRMLVSFVVKSSRDMTCEKISTKKSCESGEKG